MSTERKTVVLTRRRWGAYMLAFLFASIVVAVVGFVATGEMRLAAVPIIVVPFWILIHFGTPKAGMESPTIGASPGTILMLWTIVGAALLTVMVTLVDFYLLGRTLNSPFEPYHLFLFAPPFVLIFVGAYRADRLKRSPNQDSTAEIGSKLDQEA